MLRTKTCIGWDPIIENYLNKYGTCPNRGFKAVRGGAANGSNNFLTIFTNLMSAANGMEKVSRPSGYGYLFGFGGDGGVRQSEWYLDKPFADKNILDILMLGDIEMLLPVLMLSYGRSFVYVCQLFFFFLRNKIWLPALRWRFFVCFQLLCIQSSFYDGFFLGILVVSSLMWLLINFVFRFTHPDISESYFDEIDFI